MKEKEENTKCPLVNKRVTLYPITRGGSWLEKIHQEHDGRFLISGSKIRMYGLAWNSKKRQHEDPLTLEERQWFESTESGLGLEHGDMSVIKKNNFWKKFEVVLEKEPVVFDMSNIMDFLRVKFLITHSEIIAKTWDERFDKATIKYAFKDAEVELERKIERINKEKVLNQYFYGIENSVTKMTNLVTMYYTYKKSGKKVSRDANTSTLSTIIDELIKSDVKGMYEVIQDKNFELKLFISSAIEKGIIEKPFAGIYKIVGEEDEFTLTELIKFLSLKKNQAIKAKIEAQIEI